ncbi:hypothetical protein RRG08_011776 [Elysia crispata]|uniref:RanBP2-type domain-containing protein n=1 Tax=Elysia crispata TaxID=231223 RepID=A0AAE1DHG7_9GAST|nr:hypothetical protein RRG08_011776 [Elysia crispata]
MDLQKLPHSGNESLILSKPSNNDTTQKAYSIHWPSDEQPQLASQAEDMASLLLSNSSGYAISERLQRFAKDVANLEDRASKYQAIIQRLQVQLQQLSETSNGQLIAQLREQVRNLKEEIETLQTNAQKHKLQASQISGEMEHGWVTVSNPSNPNPMENNTETMSMMLYPDSPLMKRIDELQNTNAKLFQANKDWHTKWEQLRQSKHNEKEELASRLKAAEEEIKKLRAEIVSLENKAKDKKEKEGNSRYKEKDTQIGLLKEQMTVFLQDFDKEKKEKKLFQERLVQKENEIERLKIELQQRVKSLQTEVRSKEDKIKANNRDLNRLQFRVAELLDEVKKEKRRANSERSAEAMALQPYIAQQAGAPPSAGKASLVYPSSSGAHLAKLYGSQFGIGHRQGPEEFPGAWTCPDCTYINYPDRTVCDICGFKKLFEDQTGFSDIGELHSRGSSPSRFGLNVPDSFNEVEVD